MNDRDAQSEQSSEQDNAGWHVLHVRKRPFAEWLAWLIWLVILGVLLEYALTSFTEQEPQAGMLAAGIFAGLLLTGIIIEVVKVVEARS